MMIWFVDHENLHLYPAEQFSRVVFFKDWFWFNYEESSFISFKNVATGILKKSTVDFKTQFRFTVVYLLKNQRMAKFWSTIAQNNVLDQISK